MGRNPVRGPSHAEVIATQARKPLGFEPPRPRDPDAQKPRRPPHDPGAAHSIISPEHRTVDIRTRFWQRCQNRVRISTVLCSGDMMLCAAPGSWGGLLGFWASGSRGLGGSKPNGFRAWVAMTSAWLGPRTGFLPKSGPGPWARQERCPNRAS